MLICRNPHKSKHNPMWPVGLSELPEYVTTRFQLLYDVIDCIISPLQGTTEAKEMMADDDQIFLQQLQVSISFCVRFNYVSLLLNVRSERKAPREVMGTQHTSSFTYIVCACVHSY